MVVLVSFTGLQSPPLWVRDKVPMVVITFVNSDGPMTLFCDRVFKRTDECIPIDDNLATIYREEKPDDGS